MTTRRADLPALNHWSIGHWRDWFTRHGIDPDTVLAGTSVEADDGARTVTYLTVHRDAHGDPHSIAGCQVWRNTSAASRPGVQDYLCTMNVVHQLEARPLPFPAAAKETT